MYKVNFAGIIINNRPHAKSNLVSGNKCVNGKITKPAKTEILKISV